MYGMAQNCGTNQSRITLKQIRHCMSVLPSLLHRIRYALLPSIDEKIDDVSVDRTNAVQLPILDFDDQHSPSRMEDKKIGVHIPTAYGYIVPTEVVIFEMRLQASREAPLSRRHVPGNAG